jgi:outer membrane receptor for ferrienterochelin and colicins
MRSFFGPLCAVLFPFVLHAQHDLRLLVVDSASAEPIPGASVVLKSPPRSTTADGTGKAGLTDLPAGQHTVTIAAFSYRTAEVPVTLPRSEETPIIIRLAPADAELEEVVVEATRSNRSIADIPTRVEVLTEEIDEAASMDPSKVAHLLTHSTGIQVQQTSATNNTANVRIQGLDGRYTQILKDGFPLYGGFGGSLSIMQIPPLDLRQVEYVKGSASTLYGGGAIAGLINLLSKNPDKDETLLHINASQIGAIDLNAYTSHRSGTQGFTLLAQRNTHAAFDADNDGFTDLPALIKYNVNPRLFFGLGKPTRLTVGATITNEDREGGDLRTLDHGIPDSAHFYRERNDVDRLTMQVKLEHDLSHGRTLALRQSVNRFHRGIETLSDASLDTYLFVGDQTSTFTDLSLSTRKGTRTLVAGLNLYTDDFHEDRMDSAPNVDEQLTTVGGYVNHVFDASRRTSLESGMRVDHAFGEGTYVLPRVYGLMKWSPKWTSRAGGGLGYRAASVFNQEAEQRGYQDVRPIDRNVTEAERSYSASADLGYRTTWAEHYTIILNQMLFWSAIDGPLVLTGDTDGGFHFRNADGQTRSYGAETFFKFGFYDFMFFAGYTWTKAEQLFGDSATTLPLTPEHSLKGDLLYALPGKWRIGVDYEYKSPQRLSTGRKTIGYWTFGGVVERSLGPLTVLVNVENFFDERQTRHESLLTGPNGTPQFTEVWAPLDGFVINAGIKLRL